MAFFDAGFFSRPKPFKIERQRQHLSRFLLGRLAFERRLMHVFTTFSKACRSPDHPSSVPSLWQSWHVSPSFCIIINEFSYLSSTWSIIPLTLHFIVGTMTLG